MLRWHETCDGVTSDSVSFTGLLSVRQAMKACTGPRGRSKKGAGMASKPKKDNTLMPKKTYWHLYSLQALQSKQLAKVINKVLQREYVLIK